MFCLHIFAYVLSRCRMDFMVSGGNWLNETPITNCYPSNRGWILGYHQGYVYCKSDVTTIYTPLMMAQDQTESTRIKISYGTFNHFSPVTVKSFQQLERTYIEICRQNICTLFSEVCIIEEMQPKYTF